MAAIGGEPTNGGRSNSRSSSGSGGPWRREQEIVAMVVAEAAGHLRESDEARFIYLLADLAAVVARRQLVRSTIIGDRSNSSSSYSSYSSSVDRNRMQEEKERKGPNAQRAQSRGRSSSSGSGQQTSTAAGDYVDDNAFHAVVTPREERNRRYQKKKKRAAEEEQQPARDRRRREHNPDACRDGCFYREPNRSLHDHSEVTGRHTGRKYPRGILWHPAAAAAKPRAAASASASPSPDRTRSSTGNSNGSDRDAEMAAEEQPSAGDQAAADEEEADFELEPEKSDGKEEKQPKKVRKPVITLRGQSQTQNGPISFRPAGTPKTPMSLAGKRPPTSPSTPQDSAKQADRHLSPPSALAAAAAAEEKEKERLHPSPIAAASIDIRPPQTVGDASRLAHPSLSSQPPPPPQQQQRQQQPAALSAAAAAASSSISVPSAHV